MELYAGELIVELFLVEIAPPPTPTILSIVCIYAGLQLGDCCVTVCTRSSFFLRLGALLLLNMLLVYRLVILERATHSGLYWDGTIK